jgi:ABC-type nitrate/sulfonate/bicarbonate transport system substrate-binding protein
MSRRATLWLCGAVVLGLVAAGCGSGGSSGEGESSNGGSGGEKTHVTYALGFAPNYVQAYFFDALKKGYYEEEGLEVSYVVPESTQTAAKLVGIGKADLGEFTGPDPITAHAEGIPVEVATTWQPAAEYGILFEKGKFTEPKELEGQTVADYELLYAEVCRPKFFEANGTNPDNVSLVNGGFLTIPPLIAGKVQGAEGEREVEGEIYANEAGEEPGFFSYSSVCPQFPQGTFVNSSWAEANPKAATGFITATLKGVKDFVEDPAGVKAVFEEKFPELQEPLPYYTAAAESFCGKEAGKLGLGYNSSKQWEELVGVAKEGGVIESLTPVDEVVTDEYLPKTPIKAKACT